MTAPSIPHHTDPQLENSFRMASQALEPGPAETASDQGRGKIGGSSWKTPETLSREPLSRLGSGISKHGRELDWRLDPRCSRGSLGLLLFTARRSSPKVAPVDGMRAFSQPSTACVLRPGHIEWPCQTRIEMSIRRAQRPQGPPTSAPSTLPAPAPAAAAADTGAEEAAIPEIGKGLRWYDGPYLLLTTVQRSKVMKHLPVRWRLKVREATSFMYQTHHTRERRQSNRRYRLDTIYLPAGEGVAMPSAWVVEYFTASDIGKLYRAIRRSGWNGARFLGTGPRGTDSLTTSRQGQGQTWWQMAELTRKPGAVAFLEAQQAKLPRGVERVSLTGVSIGKGLTAVVAEFSLDDSVSARLNQRLHAPHQYEVIRRKGQRAVSQAPPAVLHFHVQRARDAVHQELRGWMGHTLPGTFARSRQRQPLFDLIFFNVADPITLESDDRPDKNDALRSIGVNSHSVYRVISGELPGLIFEQPDLRDWAPEIGENVWTLWGNRRAEKELTRGTGSRGLDAVGHFVGIATTDFMTRVGLTAFLKLLRSDASAAHDNARRLHGGTSSRDLKRLRNRTLTTSLDLATLEEDVREYNNRRWRDREPQFYLDYFARFKKLDEEEGRTPFKPLDMNKRERKTQKRMARELVAFDAEYREVLSTVASLGASLDSRRVQRVAIWVSVVSVGVALVTLWATQSPPPDLVASGCAVLASLGWGICL